MKIVSFDTSSDALSIAISVDGELVKEWHQISKERHSSALIPALGKLLREAKLQIKDIDVIAVGLGPGSFTGIRVAVVTAKMLGAALNKKIVGVSSLEAIARSFLNEQNPKVAVLLDARKSKAYGAAYELKKGRIGVTCAPALCPHSDSLIHLKRGYKVVGDIPGLSVSGDDLKPKARWVVEAGYDLARQKKFITPAKLEPDYLHPRDCNVTVKK